MFTRSATRVRGSVNAMQLGGLRSMSTAEPEVLVERDTNCVSVVLNRPRALNALNLPMIRTMLPLYQELEANPHVKVIVLKGAGGKAFCAGGDIRAIYDAVKGPNAGKDTIAQDFFREEYQLDHLIGSLETPHVALIDGITMGGGVGLSVHGQVRVCTENTVFSFPETAIGLFPDVGGSYLLSRLAHPGLGMYLGLTGDRLKATDTVHAGIATHFVPHARIGHLEQRLGELDHADLDGVRNAVLEMQGEVPAFSLQDKLPLIQECFTADSVEEILERLRTNGSEWANRTADRMLTMSPISMKITHRQLQEGATKSFADCFVMEYRMSQRCMQGEDFFEGVRSVLVDRDNKPQWQPDDLAQITPAMVDEYFKPLDNDLELLL